MKFSLILILAIVFILACKQKGELDYIAFKVPKDVMIDSLKTATVLLDQMDYGNGASCGISDGQIHYTRKEKGFNIVDLPGKNSSSIPVIAPFDQANSIRLFNLIHFLSSNGLPYIGKRYDGIYSFLYKQIDYNPNNDFKNSRIIIYLKTSNDTSSGFFKDYVFLDQYKNLLLLAPKSYHAPKLPMDEKSIMKRRDDAIKKQHEKN